MTQPGQEDRRVGRTTGQGGRYYDPWGKPYIVEIDGDYTNQDHGEPLREQQRRWPKSPGQGVIAWSLGKDQAGATAGRR